MIDGGELQHQPISMEALGFWNGMQQLIPIPTWHPSNLHQFVLALAFFAMTIGLITFLQI